MTFLSRFGTILFTSLFPVWIFADSYQPLTDLPGFTVAAGNVDLPTLVNILYQYSIAIGVLLAVFLIIYYGATYMTTDIVGRKVNLRTNLVNVIAGLVVILSAYIVLNFINPQLVVLELGTLGQTNFKATERTGTAFIESTPATFESDLSAEQIAQDFIGDPTVETYIAVYGVEPGEDATVYVDADGVERVKGTIPQDELTKYFERVRANAGNIATAADTGSTGRGGNSSEGGAYNPTDSDRDLAVQVNREAQHIVTYAFSQLCTDIPLTWAEDSDLYRLIAKESGGRAGIPNYAMSAFVASESTLNMELVLRTYRDNCFYYRYCNRSGKSESGCSGQSTSDFSTFLNKQQSAGVKGYSQFTSPNTCASAVGIGQLNKDNLVKYQPGGVSTIGSAPHEVCGMARYIKARYGDPSTALVFHIQKGWY